MYGKEESIKEIKQNYITNLLSGKSYKDENFPVASFIIRKKTRELIRMFYFFARTADDVADHAKLQSREKLRILNFFDQSLKIGKKVDILVIDSLITYFKKLKFAKKYSRNLLKAFKLDAKKRRYKNWNELLYYCKYSANPVGRFFIDLAYIEKKKEINNREIILKSSDNLCTALQIINHLQDCKKDYKKLDRVYLPTDLFKKYSISINSLDSPISSRSFSDLKKEMVLNIEKLLNQSQKGLKYIEIWRLRKETLIIFNIAKRLCFLIKENDPLEKKIKLSRIDLIFCFIKGIIS